MNRPERNFTTEHIRLERRLPSYWRVTFDIPPVNIFGPKELPQLNDIITAIERDEQVKVVVFDSAVEGLRGKVPNLDDAGFARIAGEAEKNCPVSKVLNATITLDAKLV
jgi:hypothetical protein